MTSATPFAAMATPLSNPLSAMSSVPVRQVGPHHLRAVHRRRLHLDPVSGEDAVHPRDPERHPATDRREASERRASVRSARSGCDDNDPEDPHTTRAGRLLLIWDGS